MKTFSRLLKLLKIFTVLSGKKRIIALVGLLITMFASTNPELSELLNNTFTAETVSEIYDWFENSKELFGGLGVVGIIHAIWKDYIEKKSLGKETTE